MSVIVRYALTRFASACVTLFGVALLVFAAIHAMPGSFEDVMIPQAPQAIRDVLAERLGLNKPFLEQLGLWLAQVVQGNLGDSLVSQESVAKEYLRRLPATAEIAGLAAVFALLIGLPFGIYSGLTSNRRYISQVNRLGGGLAMSVPDFVIGAAMLYLFTRYSLWFTVGNWVPISEDLISNLRSALLPAFALSLLGIGLITATARHATLSVLGQDFITAAVARGKRPSVIVRQHVLRNIGIPIITIIAIYSGYLLGGTIIVENLFSVPGVGRYLITGVLNRDYPVVQAGVILAASFFIMLNMIADVSYAVLDPRISRRRS